jgi:uncharacterized protein
MIRSSQYLTVGSSTKNGARHTLVTVVEFVDGPPSDKSSYHRYKKPVFFEAEMVMANRPLLVVVGVDLAGSPRRPTGVCVLRGLKARTRIARADEEILSAIDQVRPLLVPIDAPLSLPVGRMTIADRSGVHFRACDVELRRLGIRFFPITLGPMRMLTERGLALKAKIEALGYRVVECYPGGAQDLWGLPRQHRDRPGLRRGLEAVGVRGLTEAMTGDELDAVTAALVGRWFLLGQGEMLGGEEGILMPSGDRRPGRTS